MNSLPSVTVVIQKHQAFSMVLLADGGGILPGPFRRVSVNILLFGLFLRGDESGR